MNVFYSSKFMVALSELEGLIRHQTASDEDAMFDTLAQSKGRGLKPAEAAVSYFIGHARRGIAEAPGIWGPITRKAARRARMWVQQKKVRKEHAEALFRLASTVKADEVETVE